VAEAAIARVEARNGGLTAIVDFDPAEARASADAVDAVASRALTDRWWACLTP
jgi:Asp-tRNA(Asn)/Glu-tRNA(Gln) amidotransferase A subunit family amidase